MAEFLAKLCIGLSNITLPFVYICYGLKNTYYWYKGVEDDVEEDDEEDVEEDVEEDDDIFNYEQEDEDDPDKTDIILSDTESDNEMVSRTSCGSSYESSSEISGSETDYIDKITELLHNDDDDDDDIPMYELKHINNKKYD